MSTAASYESVIDREAGGDLYLAMYLQDLDTATEAAIEAFEYFPATDRLRDLCRQIQDELRGLGVENNEVVALDKEGGAG